MIKPRTRLLCFVYVVTFAGASWAGASAPRVHATIERHDGSPPAGGGVWPETVEMALFGAALSYGGVRLGRRKG